MATRHKITELIASIKTVYPYYAKDTDVTALVRLWTALLKPYPDRAVEAALYRALQTCKVPPTPADLMEYLRGMRETTQLSDEALWDVFAQTLSQVNVQLYRLKYPLVGEDPRERLQALWEGLPPRLQAYVGSLSEMVRLARGMDDVAWRYERARFFKTLAAVKRREEHTALAVMGGYRDRLTADNTKGEESV